ncbi:MAG: DsbA family protein, partial [Acetobacteraceae bacterium]|nr:DsbA family protein [Acetobacteraceae bacterium]
MAEIECFFDCSSPWTYFAFHNLRQMEQDLDVQVAWRPILVGGVFNAENPSVYNSRDKPVPAKAAYNKKDQMNWAGYLGIRMHYRPTVFPVNSVKAMRGCLLLEPEGKLVPFAQAVFEAYWRED